GGGDDTEDRGIYQEVSYENDNEKRGLATRTKHLLWNLSPVRQIELYDLAADPMEEHDIWSTSPGGKALQDRLGAMIDEVSISPDAARALLRAPPSPTTSTRR